MLVYSVLHIILPLYHVMGSSTDEVKQKVSSLNEHWSIKLIPAICQLAKETAKASPPSDLPDGKQVFYTICVCEWDVTLIFCAQIYLCTVEKLLGDRLPASRKISVAYSSLFLAVDCMEQKVLADANTEKEMSEDSTQAFVNLIELRMVCIQTLFTSDTVLHMH